MHSKYGLDDRGTLKFYRGLEFTQDHEEGSWSICNEKYVEQIVETAGYSQANPCQSPEDMGVLLTKEDQASDEFMRDFVDPKYNNSYTSFLDHFRKLLGMLMYISPCWRGDITHVLSPSPQEPCKSGRSSWAETHDRLTSDYPLP